MSNIANFNRTSECDKISADCINAETKMEQTDDTTVCLYSSWGDTCIDFTDIVKNAESCTTIYLSPDQDPNCLVYEPEEKCGDNICIHGDDLSRIISMHLLKDVDQTTPLMNGDVYIYDSTTHLFKPYNLGDFITNYNTTIGNLQNQIQQILNKLTPPADAPDNVTVMFGNINVYSDPNVVIEEGSGIVTTLDKNHGLYTHLLANNVYGDEIFG